MYDIIGKHQGKGGGGARIRGKVRGWKQKRGGPSTCKDRVGKKEKYWDKLLAD
jgi:hypothetical protein